MLASIIFYSFSFVLISSAVMVISAKNPVHAVLFLILAFFNSAALFLLLGAEFVAMLMIIVYVGAVAVLFLFIVMMLDVDFAALKADFVRFLPVLAPIAFIILFELVFILYYLLSSVDTLQKLPTVYQETNNTLEIGKVLYTKHLLAFQLSGLILLVAMVSAIVLTLRVRPGVRKQNISKQVSRTRAESIELINIQSGKGV